MKKVLFFLVILSCSFLYAHSGKTDSHNGHYDNKTGRYHYHYNPDTSSTFPFMESDFLTIPPGTVVTTADTMDSDTPDILQKEIIRLRAKNREQTEQIEQLRATCISLKKENKALRKSLAELNLTMPVDYNDSNALNFMADTNQTQKK